VKAVERGSMSASFNDVLSAEAFWNELEANKVKFMKAVKKGSISSSFKVNRYTSTFNCIH